MKNIYVSLAIVAGALCFSSCNDFLDKLPDDRASLDTFDKVKSILVDAYNTKAPDFLMEFSSDNVANNGKQYNVNSYQDEVYRFVPCTSQSNDTPKYLWNSGYASIGAANEALGALSTLGLGAQGDALKAEALLCRAWGMFQLANCFCMAWNPEKAEEYLGLPYPKVAGVSVDSRGTLKELFENINADIEEALPLLDDSYLAIPKYHFNTKAAYAFAARFNLYYMNYQKAFDYASKVLGSNPLKFLRDMPATLGLGATDFGNQYPRSDANIMLQTAYSIHGRTSYSSSYARYGHNRAITSAETFWARAPWGSGSTNNVLVESHKLYGGSPNVSYRRLQEFFETTDKVNNTGYPHIVDPVFTYDETILVRAEAACYLKDYDSAINDLNTWITAHTEATRGSAKRPTLTVESVNTFWDGLKDVPADFIETAGTTAKERGIKKPFHPQGFTVEPGTQTNMLQQVLFQRRIETLYQGYRFTDCKRYGIQYPHHVDNEPTLVFVAGDLRGAIQLPDEAIAAGLEANPRAEQPIVE